VSRNAQRKWGGWIQHRIDTFCNVCRENLILRQFFVKMGCHPNLAQGPAHQKATFEVHGKTKTMMFEENRKKLTLSVPE
jgi:hypothetical protein